MLIRLNIIDREGKKSVIDIEEAIKPTTHSRLGCQVELKKEYNNITVTIAPH